MVRVVLRVDATVLERAKALLKGAPKKVRQHRLSVGIHEQEASEKPIKVGSRKANTDRAKKNYRGGESHSYLIDVAAVHEFGSGWANLPERSWLRSWFDLNLDRLEREATSAMHAEYAGDKEAVTSLAGKWSDELRHWISSDVARLAPLAESTEKARAAAGLPAGPPLYATHQLVDAIRGLADGRYIR